MDNTNLAARRLRLLARRSALAEHIHAGNYYDCPWQFFCYGQFKGLNEEESAFALAAWCKRQSIAASFEIRKVREVEVVYLVLRSRAA